MGTVSWSAEIYPLRRRMGGGILARFIIVRYLKQLVHTAHHNCFVHRVGGDRIEFYRTLGLRCEYRRFACCVNHFGGVLDLALGPPRSRVSTPMTVCLAVMGRHVPRLEFLGVLLSEDQPLAPHEGLYHRLLSFSMDSAEEFVTKYAETGSLSALYDNVLIPAIAAVETDAHNDSLSAENGPLRCSEFTRS